MRPLTRRLSVLVPALLLTAGIQVAGSTAHSAPPTAGDVRLAASESAISDSWIVALKANTTSIDAVAGELTRRNNARLTHTYRSALNGFSATMTQAQARALAADPRVAYVEQDSKVTLTATQNNATWGIDRIDQRNLPLSGTYTYNTTASNVHVYVIDTGLRTSHSEFGGRASIGTDTVGDGQNGNDCQGHGTHVAGTAAGSTYGVAKGAAIVGVRVLDCNGSGSNSAVIAGVDWVTANAIKPAVANMSLGGGANTTLDNAVKKSITSGVTYSLAAGNGDFFGNPQNACNTSPARVAEAITVGATDSADKRASFSNYGTCLDLFAPGVSITSAWKDSNTATKTISGTSMAAPHTAGAAALYLAANPTATPAQVRDALVNGATTGKVQDPKTGSPNRLLYTLF
ncbi:MULTISPECIES: S8 family peptidase [unclassified Streptomyces]|uniref:S8 family peptidase n=1 Tax=unclassified Streptomyces TaxID=2593676 RepID=UPI000DC757DB|nr:MULTISPECIES: S8 family peptidase [unclassified Streptomyces]AWZ10460.1 S8 family peptidase [Streptomyces sp. ICC4]AWZ18003.1 S8 family peptidase [Streptomyces sp. ICC1]